MSQTKSSRDRQESKWSLSLLCPFGCYESDNWFPIRCHAGPLVPCKCPIFFLSAPWSQSQWVTKPQHRPQRNVTWIRPLFRSERFIPSAARRAASRQPSAIHLLWELPQWAGQGYKGPVSSPQLETTVEGHFYMGRAEASFKMHHILTSPSAPSFLPFPYTDTDPSQCPH